MAKVTRSFLAGKMNKVVDERILPEGEYIDAMNIRMGSTENSEQGVIENVVGNQITTELQYNGIKTSTTTVTIGSYADSRRNTIYWFVHDNDFKNALGTDNLDMIVSFNVITNKLTYHVISVKDFYDNTRSTLNFNPDYLITGVNMIGDLLFFTDDINPPRCININTSYGTPNASYIDDELLGEKLLVIKKPPAYAPTIELSQTGDQTSDYLTERLISFAYRYRYADGQYSATSPWSDIAFSPDDFSFSINSFLNEGMVNRYNTAKITYYTGSKLVESIELLYKEANKNVIKVIENIDKNQFLPNSFETYQFSDSKIFTILSESELLRLYDNVPLIAKAQTIMGNRLMYGNYVEGYDLVDSSNQKINLGYYTELITNDVGFETIPTTFSTGNYTIDGVKSIAQSKIDIDFDGISLKSGSNISIGFTISHADFSGTVTPTGKTTDTQYNIDIQLNNDYANAFQLSTSVEFESAIGTIANIKQMAFSCDGVTLTDIVNCGLPSSLAGTPTTFKRNYGIDIQQEPIKITSSPTSSKISLQLTATYYADTLTGTPTDYAYEYYKFINATVEYQKIASPRSLHSNRDYEIGIVYMDDYGRASTALVSQDNTEHIPCSNSATQNQIRVYIPINDKPPYWATRYKFVIKSSGYNYETVYSSISFKDPTTPYVYLLLEGENARKVEAGDRLIVKSDSNGPTNRCVYATVLEKEAKPAEFITPAEGIKPPSGVYMKMSPNDFSTATDSDAVFAPGDYYGSNASGGYAWLHYPMNKPNPASPGNFIDVDIPAGSRINLKFYFERLGAGDGNNQCERRIYTLEKTLVSSNNYANAKDWWDGDNVSSILDSGIPIVGGTGCPIENIYYSSLASTYFPFNGDYCKNQYQFIRILSTQELVLYVTGTKSCGTTKKRQSKVKVNIEIYRNTNTYIFETEPTDTLPDVFYENHLAFPINSSGYHTGNVQNQKATQPAIIDTEFFNCFTFGNGAESYKIRDSIIGREFNLGERVTSVSQLDYRRADRYADITYSGVYNQETNLNKLNEFNLGLINYKNLERSFGDIYILDGRQTDVLVLQEDKISYVLAGKNLLSDASAGNVITATPEVLGTQIARTEDYGISFNPESYVQWGYDRYFTDVKRGAVLQIKGDSSQSDQLMVISEMGMRTWFRDVFIDSFDKQKLGAYDPYMNEYVLSMNDRDLPVNPQCIDCGTPQTFILSNFESIDSKIFEYCVDFGPNTDSTTNVYVTVQSIAPASYYKVNVIYNDIISAQMSTTSNNTDPKTITFNKNSQLIETATIRIEYKGSVTLTINTECPVAGDITIVEFIVTNLTDANKTVHNIWNYKNGAYISPTISRPNTFGSAVTPLPHRSVVTRYTTTTGQRGTTNMPDLNYQMIFGINKSSGDTFQFNPNFNRLKWSIANTLKNSTQLLNELNSYPTLSLTPTSQNQTTYTGTFTITNTQNYVYLVHDLRKAYMVYLCYGDSDSLPKEVGCDCNKCSNCSNIKFTPISGAGNAQIYFPIGKDCGTIGSPVTETISAATTLCVPEQEWYILSGIVKVEYQYCSISDTLCSCGDCKSYTLNNNTVTTTIQYINCATNDLTNQTLSSTNDIWCAKKDTFVILSGTNKGFTVSDGCGCCPDPNNECVTYKFSALSDGVLEYKDCNNEIVSKNIFASDGDLYFCAKIGTPTFTVPHECTILVHNPCGCYI